MLALEAQGGRVVPCYARGGFTFRGGERHGERASIGLGLRFDPEELPAADESTRRAA